MAAYFNPLKRSVAEAGGDGSPCKRPKTLIIRGEHGSERAKAIMEKLVGIDIERKRRESTGDPRAVLRAMQRADIWRLEDGSERLPLGVVWNVEPQRVLQRSMKNEFRNYTTIWIQTKLSSANGGSGDSMLHVPSMSARLIIDESTGHLTMADMRIAGVHTDAYLCTRNITVIADSTTMNFHSAQSKTMDALLRVAKTGQNEICAGQPPPGRFRSETANRTPVSAYTVALPYGEQLAFDALRTFFDSQKLDMPVSDDYINRIVDAFKAIRFAGPVALGESVVPAERVPVVVRRAYTRKLARSVYATIAYNRWRRFTIARIYSPDRLRAQGVFDKV